MSEHHFGVSRVATPQEAFTQGLSVGLAFRLFRDERHRDHLGRPILTDGEIAYTAWRLFAAEECDANLVREMGQADPEIFAHAWNDLVIAEERDKPRCMRCHELTEARTVVICWRCVAERAIKAHDDILDLWNATTGMEVKRRD